MSDGNHIAHYGVKGMRWGVRKGTAGSLVRAYTRKTETRQDKGHVGEKVTKAKLARADHKYIKQTRIVGKKWVQTYNNASADFNRNALPKINKKYDAAAKRGDLLKWGSPNHTKYWNEISMSWGKSLDKAAEGHGVSPSGKYRYVVAQPVGSHPATRNPLEFKLMAVKINDVEHAGTDDDVPPDVIGTLNPDGTVLTVEPVGNVEHSDVEDRVDEFLAHYGVKGMRWGVRKVTGKARTKAENKARSARKDIKSRRRQVSDKQLSAMIERLQNEKKLKELVNDDLRPGRTVAAKILSESGQKAIKTILAGAGVYATKALLEKSFDAKTAATYIAPKPKK